MQTIQTDLLIVGSGAAGLFCALHLPRDKRVLLITKEEPDLSDSFLAQGGICVQHDEEDYDSFMEDTLKAGHYENDRQSVDLMIRRSRDVIDELIGHGVDFARKNGALDYTREGGHSKPRILYHADVTGKEITSKLLAAAQQLPNVTLMPHTCMLDLLCTGNACFGAIARLPKGDLCRIEAAYTVLACGGLGGLFTHSTNYRHLTGDALAIALKHGIALKHVDYIQIHPTTLYSQAPGRRFLISESVRGEGALLLDKHMQRFTNELQPRDVVTQAIYAQMQKDGTDHVWLSMAPIPRKTILSHFPNIYERCLEEGYDCTRECIPVVPAQHYFMGGIAVDLNSKASMDRLYAVGETSCNGVHGANRLASNSLLESLVFGQVAAQDIAAHYALPDPALLQQAVANGQASHYADDNALFSAYRKRILTEIERSRQHHA